MESRDGYKELSATLWKDVYSISKQSIQPIGHNRAINGDFGLTGYGFLTLQNIPNILKTVDCEI